MQKKILFLCLILACCYSSNAQCNAGFIYSFDAPTNKLSCISNYNGQAYRDGWQIYDLATGAIFQGINIDTMVTTIPYGTYNLAIYHTLFDTTTIPPWDDCTVIDTITIDNTDGTKCDPNFLRIYEFITPADTLIGVNFPWLNHVWIYNNDTISTTYSCTIPYVSNYIITHIVYNDTCLSSVTDTIGLLSVSSVNETSFPAIDNLYPNPTNGNATLALQLAKPEKTTVSIVNMVGQMVYNQTYSLTAGAQLLELPTNTLPAGMYYISLYNSNGGPSLVKKIIKN